MITTPQIICDIIQKVTKIPKENLWIYNQRRSIPEDQKLYVIVGLVSVNVYANNKRQESTSEGLNDFTSQYAKEIIQIDLISYTTEALIRYHEILGALISTYSQQQQELLGLKIAEIPSSVNDTSDVEGAARLFRISITVPVLRKYDTIMNAEFYDKLDHMLYSEEGEVI